MTVTQDEIDLSWVEFADDDPVEACVVGAHFKSHDRPAVGALYFPLCGRHPLCRQCLIEVRAHVKTLIQCPGCGNWHLGCLVHMKVGKFPKNPIWIVGGG